MKKFLSLMPLRKFHGHIHERMLHRKRKLAFRNNYIKPIQSMLKNNPNAMFLVLTPEHDNLGDHAIALSETKMLQELSIDFIEIPWYRLSEISKHDYLSIMNGHPIMINGGGNMGTLWFHVEMLHRNIIKANPKSPIFIMPNTIFYEDSDWGREQFQESIDIYNKHKNLHLFAREKFSFEVMKSAYNNVSLIPDMVLALDESGKQQERHGCLLCLRSDKEKTIDDATYNTILEGVHELFGNDVKHTDMAIGENVPIPQREYALETKYSEFRSARLVITDRLHGMIFCAITGTPCIVIDSRSPKLRGCYDWIKDFPYIKFVEAASAIPETYHTIPLGSFTYDPSLLSHYYDSLKRQIVSVLYGE